MSVAEAGWRQLESERAALHQAEQLQLSRQIAHGLDHGDVRDSAVALLAIRKLGPFESATSAVSAAVLAKDPALAEELFRGLAARTLGEESARFTARAQALEIQRLAQELQRPDGPARARYVGVTVAMAEAILKRALALHVDPDAAAMARGGRSHLTALAQALGQPLDQTGPDDTPPDLAQWLLRDVSRAERAGVPRSLAAGEWVAGALRAVDPYAAAIWPAELTGWEAEVAGVRLGVGLELAQDDSGVFVALPTPGGPAFLAGIHQGDRLVGLRENNGVVAVGSDGLAAAQAALTGEPGTSITLSIARDSEVREVSLVRAAVPVQDVFGWSVGPNNQPHPWVEHVGGVAYLRIARFRPGTDEAVTAIVDEMETPSGLIVDLRGNVGGDVQAAANIADLFVESGVVAELRGPGAPTESLADNEVAWNTMLAGGAGERWPLVVLVDEETASAAEILASALRVHRGARVIGERTVGKGWSQSLVSLDPHPVALQITTARWTLPDGTELERRPGRSTWGVHPDQPLVFSAAEDWFGDHRRRAAEYPKWHLDGSPIDPPEMPPSNLPTPSADVGIAAAAWHLRR